MALTYIKLYGDFLEEAERLTDAEVGRLVRAMLRHFRGDEAPDAALTGNEGFLYPRWRLQIDRDRAAYDRQCATNRRNGRLGGRPRPVASCQLPVASSRQTVVNNQLPVASSRQTVASSRQPVDSGRQPVDDAAPAATVTAVRKGPPTLEQVRAYCAEHRLVPDPERFFHHYQSNDWTVSGWPLYDWRAKLREWDARDRASPPPPVPGTRQTAAGPPANPALDYAQRAYRDEDFGDDFFVIH